MQTKIISAAIVASVAGAASAGVFFESESNDTLATANHLGSYDVPGDGIVVDGSIFASGDNGSQLGDVDWFSFTLDNTATALVAALFDLNPADNNDGYMGLFDSTGTEIVSDDDSNIGLMPSLQAFNLAAGTYYIALSGFPDFLFEGDHQESFEYKLIIGLNIPAPGALAALGLGIAATRRRR